MGDLRILTQVGAVIEIQDDGTGRGNRGILDVATDIKPALGGFTRSFGSIERRYRISPRTNKPVPRPVVREAPEPITAELTCKMAAVNYLEQFDEDSRFTLYVRNPDHYPNNPLDYVRVDILNDAALEQIEYGDLVAAEPTTDDTDMTVPINCAAHIVIHPVQGIAIPTGLTNAVDCDIVAACVDDAGVYYAVTKADSVGLKPFLIQSPDDGATWSEVELTDLSADCTSIVVCGNFLVISAGTRIGVYTKAGVLVASHTAAGSINRLYAIDAANVVAIGAAGLVLLSEDGGMTWTTLVSGSSATLTSIRCRHIGTWYIGGANGTFLRYTNGVFSTITLPAGLAAASINWIDVPDSPAGFTRENDVYIGASNGTLYRTGDEGTSWTQVVYPDSGTGAGTDGAFTAFLGQVLFWLHTEADGSTVLKRDFCGGVGGNTNVEAVPLPANSGLNALVVIGANHVMLFGKVHAGAHRVIKVEHT